MSDGKILIMGTGGCGSGFVWNLLKRCGLETTECREWIRQGGIVSSKDPSNFPAPKVIKHLGGFLCNLNSHMDNYGWEVEHIFFCTATVDLAMAIQRGRMKRRKVAFDHDVELERYYTKLGKGMGQLLERDYPFTIVRCPTSIKDPQYCYDKLKVVLNGVTYEEFSEAHSGLIIPKKAARLDNYEEK
jgi:hypothetical protein